MANEEMLRAALYIRVSTDEQALNGDSLRMQEEELRKWAVENGYEIYDVFIDDGYTATSLNRPELQRMLDEAPNYDIVLITKLDRLNRNVRNYYKIMDILDTHGCNWKTIHEKYDTTTATGRLHINIMLSVAENETAVTSERIKAVFKNKVERGEVISHAKPVGYKIENGKMEIDEETAAWAQFAFDEFERTGSVSATLKAYNARFTPMCWKNMSQMLRNKRYIGIYESPYGPIEGFCPRLIDQSQFDSVQRLLKVNAGESHFHDAKRDYIFTRLLICPECGQKLVGVRVGNYADGAEKHTYRCNKCYRDKVCSNNYQMVSRKLERYLVEHVKELLNDQIIAFELAERENKISYKSETPKIKRKIEKLQEMYLDEAIETDRYKAKYQALKQQLMASEREDEKHSSVLTRERVDEFEKFLEYDFETLYDDLTDLEKRQLWRSVIKSVTVYRDRFEIAFA